MKQKLISSIYPLSNVKREFLLCKALDAKARIITSSYRHGIKQLHASHEQSKAAGPACRGVFFFVFSFPPTCSLHRSSQESDHLAEIPDILAAITTSRLNSAIVSL